MWQSLPVTWPMSHSWQGLSPPEEQLVALAMQVQKVLVWGGRAVGQDGGMERLVRGEGVPVRGQQR